MPIRKAARRALLRSAARMHGRRLFAALLAAPLGALGLLSSPLGRRLGWSWLIHPGRRLYRRMTRTAAERRAARDAAIRKKREDAENALDAENEDDEVADRVERPEGPVASNEAPQEVPHMSGFRFEEYAAEMEQAAQNYEPEDAMEILSMIEGLPAALTSVANVMRILAERSDSEFPLEKAIAQSFDDMYGAMSAAVAVAEDLGPLFRQVHEADIARHEDPRNGTEAEKGWNV
ncbi:hypothetical protein [Streptomyces sp. SPB074]|uniref:hypothetical protein n=1 Tax=Streptomyces sp. (strain SPB074) TaxID=465543 RepID=UPI001F166934|nr:hypothetical protein [Streptomyces sp. SPB074]